MFFGNFRDPDDGGGDGDEARGAADGDGATAEGGAVEVGDAALDAAHFG